MFNDKHEHAGRPQGRQNGTRTSRQDGAEKHTRRRYPGLFTFRTYQEPLIKDDGPGVLVLHWSRQIGKSYTLAAWAVNRVLFNPGRLVTVLSNSKENGAEFVRKCAEILQRMKQEFEADNLEENKGRGNWVKDFRMEVRIHAEEQVGRIKVLAANPRAARGFSGDLILDEFAFHEDSAAIWEAVEPILASNPDFRCRIASTGNGRHNMFYRMVSGVSPIGARLSQQRAEDAEAHDANEEIGKSTHSGAVGGAADETSALQRKEGLMSDRSAGLQPAYTASPTPIVSQLQAGAPNDFGNLYVSAAGFVVSRVTRTAAHALGVKIYDLKHERKEITPEAARAQALDKRGYDQNYECVFGDENMTLLTYELIAAAQSDAVTIDSQEWSQASLDRMWKATGYLEVGNDIGRNRDLSMVTVIEREGTVRRVVAMLKLEDMRLPDQQKQVAAVCRMPKFNAYCGDMTGLGLGLVEFLQEQFGRYKIRGVNFSSTEPVTSRMKIEGRKEETARVTEIMAVNLLTCFEERSLKDLPNDLALVDDLRKPEKITSPGGRVSIAAVRDEAGHADGFWSLALAVRAGEREYQPFAYQRVERNRLFWRGRRRGIIA